MSDQTIRRLYDALDRADGEAMAACYAPDATFEDPAFGRLEGDEVGAMWRMLCERSTDLDVTLEEAAADGSEGSAHWIARYTYTATGRPVVNDVRARFRFGADGRIAEHVDTFDLRRWAAQALGTSGRVLGFTPLLGPAVRRRARGTLEEWRAR